MKLRTGFVSNSSSSSFIVFVPSISRKNKGEVIEENMTRIEEILGEFSEEESSWFVDIKSKIKTILNSDVLYDVHYLDIDYGTEDSILNFFQKAGIKYINFEEV